MSYIYCIKIIPETQDDVNLKFREAGLEGELLVSQEGDFYICPQLSYTKWSMFPQSKQLPNSADSAWRKAITETVEFLKKQYGMTEPLGKIGWQEIKASYRCPKMESFIRELDIDG